ncbi:hypothetical protein ABZS61_23445 [Streptomyces sp. NPDC005566]|uniref:hypothetical protein n=1 Tax=Streptomyces sp. NPDC005566 TaxID=3156886 RepID=UPI0033B1B41A
MTDQPFDEDPPDYLRYLSCLQDLEDVSEADEAALVATVLDDPDVSMVEAAVNRHLERRAAHLLTDPAFIAWAQTLSLAIGDRPFLARRLREWTLLRTIALDEPWTAEELTTASDWFQRTASVVRIITSPEALSLLAEQGRTRRVRNAASRRLIELDQHRPDSIHKS